MRIQNNMLAMNTSRMLNINNNSMGKAVEKLSSGLRINRASDDAAGLAISEKMRAQVRGLNQASRNAQDGISMIQTAEGALNEVHDLLQRGRELSVQAANDTNIAGDIKALQNEIVQIKDEIDRIATTAEFNGISLLNRKSADDFDTSQLSLEERIVFGMKSGWLEESAKLISEYFGLEASNRDMPVLFVDDSGDDALAWVSYSYTVPPTSEIVSISMTADLSDFGPAEGENGTNAVGTVYNDRIIAHEMVHAIMADAMGDDFIDTEKWFKEGTAEFIHGADERVKNVTQLLILDGAADEDAARDIILARAVDLVSGARTLGQDNDSLQVSMDYAASYLAVKYIESNLDPDKTFANLIAGINDDNDASDNTWSSVEDNTTIDKASFIADFAGIVGQAYYDSLDIQPYGTDEVDTGSIMGSDHQGMASLNAEDVIPTGHYDDNPTNFNITFPVDDGFGNLETGSMELQIGANENQKIKVGLVSVTTEDLSVDKIDLTVDTGLAISSFDEAIQKVSDERAIMGAIQNRLEYAIKNLDNSSENLQSADSRIRDLDMASGMMEYTKLNILAQAAQSMLSQANSNPQGVLQLLR